MNSEVSNLDQLLDNINETVPAEDRVALGTILQAAGQRSFAPVLLFAGLIILMPLTGGIPGVPTFMGILVLLTAIQLLMHRDHLWLPRWLLRREFDRDKLCKFLEWSRPAARFVDRFLHPRMTALTHDAGRYAIAVTCVFIALAIPVMELIPFSAMGAGLALTAFGLGLIAHDGLMALLSEAITLLTLGFVIYSFL